MVHVYAKLRIGQYGYIREKKELNFTILLLIIGHISLKLRYTLMWKDISKENFTKIKGHIYGFWTKIE